METLPPELIPAILEFLDPADLRRAAAVSRLWYESAWCAGLCLRSSIVLCRCGDPIPELSILSDVVQHALGHGRQLSLSLEFMGFDDPDWPAVQIFLTLADDLLPILKYLSVTLSCFFVPGFLPALRHPAPNLRELVLLVDHSYGGARVPVPDDLFCGVAPKLRCLSLRGFPLGSTPVPAFSQVTNAHLTWINRCPNIEYAKYLPRLQRLHLAFRARSSDTTPDAFNFHGLRLSALIIDDWDYCAIMPAIARSANVAEIPVVEHICTNLHPADPLWKQPDLGAVNIRLTRNFGHESDAAILVVPAHRRWRRVYHVTTRSRDEQCPIRALPALLSVSQCVTYLRVDIEHLVALLEAGWPALSVLRALRVDCRWDGTRAPEIWPGPRRRRARTPQAEDESAQELRRYVRCPALETLALCACNAAVSFASRDVVLLGGALAQCERDTRERAALALVGVELELPVNDALLREMFSSVRSCAFGSAWDHDGGLWDEGW